MQLAVAAKETPLVQRRSKFIVRIINLTRENFIAKGVYKNSGNVNVCWTIGERKKKNKVRYKKLIGQLGIVKKTLLIFLNFLF